jgi:hypothetical protein
MKKLILAAVLAVFAAPVYAQTPPQGCWPSRDELVKTLT